MCTSNGHIISPQEILFSHEKEPETLADSDIELFFPANYDHLLSVNQQISCEGEILEEEILDAINSFSSGKSPGIDGIPIEVYKTFYTEIKKSLLASFNYSFAQGMLSETQKEGIIKIPFI